MFLVTAISILTRPNTVTALLEYINLFQSKSQWQYESNNWRSSLSLASRYLTYKPNLLDKHILLKFVPVSYA